MKITVEISDSDMQEICRFTGESKKGPAIRKLLAYALMLKRREAIVEKFISNQWGVDLKPFESGESADREADKKRAARWRS
jgi:hypothetical protein